jgi:hypothetical protein
MNSESAGRLVLGLIVVGTAIRLLLAGATGLGVDESYMVGNARQLLLGYVDHPPLHVWIAGLAMRLLGTESAFAVRLPFVLLFAGSTWLMFRLGRDLFGARAGLLAALAFNLIPVFSLAHASWVLPDGPLIFFLLAATVATARILFTEPRADGRTMRWIGAGALGGLALLSKYSAVFFFAGVLVFLATTPTFRRHLATPGPWLGALVACLLFLPVVVWNVQNEMAGLLFQGGRFSGAANLSAGRVLTSLAGQAAYLTPWFFVGLAYVLVQAVRAGPSDPRTWLPALLALGPILVFSTLTFFGPGLPHWAMPGWLFALPLLGRAGARLMEVRPRLARGGTGVAAGLFLILLAAIVFQTLHGGLLKTAAVGAPDPTVDIIDWMPLRDALHERGLLESGAVVAGEHWIDAGKAGYALGPDVPVLCLCGDPHQFRFRAPPATFAGRDAIVVFRERDGKRVLDSLAQDFDSLTPLDPVMIKRREETVLTLGLALGRNLRIRDVQ